MIDDRFEDTSDLRRLLDDRVADLRPDVAARAARAIVLGRRMRRRRRLAATSAGVAGVAAVGIVGVQLAGTPAATSPAPTPQPLAGPSATAAPHCLTGAEATRLKKKLARRAARELNRQLRRQGNNPRTSGPLDTRRRLDDWPANAPRSPKHGKVDGAVPVLPSTGQQRIALCAPGAPAVEPEKLPVSLQAQGWTCGAPGDEKFICTSGAQSALVTVRPARFHQDYLTDPDKAAPGQYVSAVHDGVFATITSSEAGVADQLGSHLVWH